MPTENRSSNEQKMVSMPSEPTDEMIVAFTEAWYSKRQCIDDPDMVDAYKAMLDAAPTAQHQGEPVACMIRSRSMSTPARIAADGRDHFTPWGEWSPATLEHGRAVTNPGRNTPPVWDMMYTYADSAEIERLRAISKDLLVDAAKSEIERLRAQLAELASERDSLREDRDGMLEAGVHLL